MMPTVNNQFCQQYIIISTASCQQCISTNCQLSITSAATVNDNKCCMLSTVNNNKCCKLSTVNNNKSADNTLYFFFPGASWVMRVQPRRLRSLVRWEQPNLAGGVSFSNCEKHELYSLFSICYGSVI